MALFELRLILLIPHSHVGFVDNLRGADPKEVMPSLFHTQNPVHAYLVENVLDLVLTLQSLNLLL